MVADDENDQSATPAAFELLDYIVGKRLAAPIEANSNAITEGLSNGWRLIYCTGPEGEQLEFVQALGPVKRVFDSARAARQKAVAG